MQVKTKLIAVMVVLILAVPLAYSLPAAPDIRHVKNETMASTAGTMFNTTGGSITTLVLNASSQNMRWKAYVGNVSGTLVLDDASGYSIFDWNLASPEGEVYATRTSGSINWGSVNCSTPVNMSREEIFINHTANPSDNISATFSTKDHNAFYVGSFNVLADSCYSLHTYKSGASQSTDFEEVILSDKENIIYATIMERDMQGYNPTQTYDFQMIVPDNGLDSWQSSIAYYFYVELT